MREYVKSALLALKPEQVKSEPITVEAVATVRPSPGSGWSKSLGWLAEGGIDSLPTGATLLISHRPITDDDGSGTLYTHPAPVAQPSLEAAIAEIKRLQDVETGLCERINALSAPVAQMPKFFRVVPKEPTDEMVNAACPVGELVDHFDMRKALRLAIAAAPKPQEPVQAVEQAVMAERERFERWILADSTLPIARDGDTYKDMTAALMWHAWQAAPKGQA
jgi:hypothetical protein